MDDWLREVYDEELATSSAVEHEQFNIIDVLMQTSMNSANTLHLLVIAAAVRDKLVVLDYLFETYIEGMEDIQQKTFLMNEALSYSARDGHFDIVVFALSHGADVHYKNEEPLRNACSQSRGRVVRLLVENGADPRACDEILERIENVSDREMLISALSMSSDLSDLSEEESKVEEEEEEEKEEVQSIPSIPSIPSALSEEVGLHNHPDKIKLHRLSKALSKINNKIYQKLHLLANAHANHEDNPEFNKLILKRYSIMAIFMQTPTNCQISEFVKKCGKNSVEYMSGAPWVDVPNIKDIRPIGFVFERNLDTSPLPVVCVDKVSMIQSMAAKPMYLWQQEESPIYALPYPIHGIWLSNPGLVTVLLSNSIGFVLKKLGDYIIGTTTSMSSLHPNIEHPELTETYEVYTAEEIEIFPRSRRYHSV